MTGGGAGVTGALGVVLRRAVTFFLALRGFLAGRDFRATEARLGLAFARPVFLTRFARLVLCARRFAMRPLRDHVQLREGRESKV